MAVIMEESSSDSDDVPLAQKLKAAPPAKPANAVKKEEEEEEVATPTPKPKPKAKAKPKPKAKAVKKEGGAAKSSDAKAGAAAVKREKKVFEMPGQTRETPEEGDPVRKFYESLNQQRPDSAMAKKWLMQHGMLPKEIAAALFAQVKAQRSKKVAGAGNGRAKPQAKPQAKPKAKPQVKRKRVVKKEKSESESESEEYIPKPTKRGRPKAADRDVFAGI